MLLAFTELASIVPSESSPIRRLLLHRRAPGFEIRCRSNYTSITPWLRACPRAVAAVVPSHLVEFFDRFEKTATIFSLPFSINAQNRCMRSRWSGLIETERDDPESIEVDGWTT